MRRIRWNEDELYWDNGPNTALRYDVSDEFTTDYRGKEWAEIKSATWNPETGVTHITVVEPVREKTLLEAAEAYLRFRYPEASLDVILKGSDGFHNTTQELVDAINRERANSNPYGKKEVEDLMSAIASVNSNYADPKHVFSYQNNKNVQEAYRKLVEQRVVKRNN